MPDRSILPRFVLGIIAFCICIVVAAILLAAESAALKAIGATVLLAYLALAFASDWILAWHNEKHVEENPHLLKNDAVGETVTVSGNFEASSGAARGLVVLHGVTWKAYCSESHVPKDGDVMVVRDREGLTLVVQSRVSSA
ncbi:MAG: NfeD family protein [Gammaproteobacteria bacterium]|jgi:membrane protein implicated in regulation of membrane protease activity